MNNAYLKASILLLLGNSVGVAYGANWRQQAQPQQRPQAQITPAQQQQMISLSLIDALVATHEEGLAGLFGYISEPSAAPAFAEFLFRTPKDLKLFIKANEKDLKETGGINEWDKDVFLYIVNITTNPSITGSQALSAKTMDRVTTLSLAPGLSLAEITMRRKH